MAPKKYERVLNDDASTSQQPRHPDDFDFDLELDDVDHDKESYSSDSADADSDPSKHSFARQPLHSTGHVLSGRRTMPGRGSRLASMWLRGRTRLRRVSPRAKLISIITAVAAVLAIGVAIAHFNSTSYLQDKAAKDKADQEWRETWMLDKLPVLPVFPTADYEGPPKDSFWSNVTTKPWLAATTISAKEVQRRAIIRSSWLRLYSYVPFDHVFVIGNPVFESTHEQGWVELIQAENRTYGDIVVVDRVYEGGLHANSYKSVEFFRWLSLRPWLNKYAWVSKVDSDSFVNAPRFYDKYIKTRIVPVDSDLAPGYGPTPGDKNDEVISVADARAIGMAYLPTANTTFIARHCKGWGWQWPGGQFYTMSRDLISLLPKLQDLGHNPHPNPGEDIRNAMILKSHGYEYDLVKLPSEEAFDYEASDARGNGSAWARSTWRQGKWGHAVGRRAINPHRLKQDSEYLEVAACFDEHGLMEPPEGL